MRQPKSQSVQEESLAQGFTRPSSKEAIQAKPSKRAAVQTRTKATETKISTVSWFVHV